MSVAASNIASRALAALCFCAALPAFGQGEIICCNQLIQVGGDWATSRRDCVDWMNQSTVNRAKVCAQLGKSGCGPSVDAGRPASDSLLALLLPAAAHAQAPSSPAICCAEAAALCGENSCKEDPAAQGFVYMDAQRVPQTRSEPSSDAPVVGRPPNGSRLRYREVVRRGGQTWFRVDVPRGATGWLAADDAGCKRPSAPPPGASLKIKPSDRPGVATSRYAQTSAHRD